MLQWTLRYEKLRLSVIPLRPKGKEPLYPWKEFQSLRAQEKEIVAWWTLVPNANIGIVTGKVSNLVVIDLDGPEGVISARNLGLTSSCISLTGNGKHLWFKHPGTNIENAVRIAPGMDIRGDGGYVVAPPSISPNGKRYRWLNALNSLNGLSPFPVSLLASVESTPIQKTGGNQEGWIAKSLEEMKDGNIDTTLTRILGRLRNDDYSPEDARAFLALHVKRVGAEDGHLEAKIANIWNRYEPRDKQSVVRSDESRGGIALYSNQSFLTIHSPTNPDSIKQFEQLHVEESSNGAFALRSGYPKLDKMLQGGLKSSRLFTVAARTGVGKTNWLLGVAREVCRSGKSVLLFSTEMPYAQIWERYIATLNNLEEFKSHKFYVCDSFAPNLEKVEEVLNATKPDVFMFDHINHVSEEVKGLGEFMQGLNFLRRKYECAGIVAAQLNRAADWVDLKTGEKVTPRMSMIKGSGTIEQASSRVLLLSETRITPEGTEIVGNLDKNDNGPKGLCFFVLKNNPYRMVEV